MKKNIIPALMIITAPIVAKGQENYFRAPELKKYEGVWLGVNGPDTLKIVFEFKEHYKYGTAFVDGIFGWYSYSRNGVVESSSFNSERSPLNASIIMGVNADGKTFATLNEKDKKGGNATISIHMVDEADPSKIELEISKVNHPEGKNFKDPNSVEEQDRRSQSHLTTVKKWELKKITE